MDITKFVDLLATLQTAAVPLEVVEQLVTLHNRGMPAPTESGNSSTRSASGAAAS